VLLCPHTFKPLEGGIMQSNAQILTNNNFQNAGDLISAAQKVGLPLWIAVAFVEAESHGANIYGHDQGGTFSGAGVVTSVNYGQFYSLVINQHHASNGVGPMQITWPGFLTDAANKGLRLWVPADNFLYGFKLVAGYLAGNYSTTSIAAAGTRYNGSSTYGNTVAQRAMYWHGVLVPPVAPSPTVLHLGSTGDAVKSLQAGLNHVFPAYSHLAVDGNFGPATESVVLDFQGRSNLLKDGVVGPLTRARLAAMGVKF
jgi:peptidoglycan hydrolase-like protein with peptidoglycan-binding domain